MARKFVNDVYRLTKDFPKDEVFGLIIQMKRAAVSIVSNIAEGSDRKSDPDFIRFLRMAITSLNEVVSCLYIAVDQKYISQQQFDIMYEKANDLAAKLNALVASLRTSTSGRP